MTGPSFARRGTAHSPRTTLGNQAILLPAGLRLSGATLSRPLSRLRPTPRSLTGVDHCLPHGFNNPRIHRVDLEIILVVQRLHPQREAVERAALVLTSLTTENVNRSFAVMECQYIHSVPRHRLLAELVRMNRMKIPASRRSSWEGEGVCHAVAPLGSVSGVSQCKARKPSRKAISVAMATFE